jgi:hypothetical protein
MSHVSTASITPLHVRSANGKDEPLMTMQVGMVGRDGIVLTGDTLQWGNPNPESSQFHEGLATWMSHTASKIKISDDNGIAVSCSGDLRGAYSLADEILASLTPEFWGSPEKRIQDITRSHIAARRWRDTQSLIILCDPMTLYQLDCFASLEGEPPSPQCQRVPIYAFSGDALNPAVYWAIRYCRTLPYEMRTLRKLTRLAVQIVVEGGVVNSGVIGGLEVVHCNGRGIHKLDESENETLLQESRQFSDQIKRMVESD